MVLIDENSFKGSLEKGSLNRTFFGVTETLFNNLSIEDISFGSCALNSVVEGIL